MTVTIIVIIITITVDHTGYALFSPYLILTQPNFFPHLTGPYATALNNSGLQVMRSQ